MSNQPDLSDHSGDLLPLQVAKMQSINFEGNIIPHSWYKQLVYPNGRVHLPAIVVLSEICYWYRPIVIKDEESGVVLGFRKKFKADKLQKSYNSFINFGLTKQQARDAIDFLKSKQIITTENRTTTLANGQKIPNQLFIEIVADKVAKLNEGSLLPVQKPMCSTEQTVCSTEQRVCSTEQTNTEITTKTTTEITTEITNSPPPPEVPPRKIKKGEREVLSKFSFEEWLEYSKYCKEVLKEPIESIEAVAESNYYKGIRDSRLETWLKEKNEKKAEPVISSEELKFVLRFCPHCFGSGLNVKSGKATEKCSHSEINEKLVEAVNEHEIDRELVEKFNLYQAQKIPSPV